MPIFSFLIYRRTLETLGSTFMWCPSLAHVAVVEKTQPVLNKMEIDRSFLEGKLNGFLPAYYLCSLLGCAFAEVPIRIPMLKWLSWVNRLATQITR